MQDYLVFSPISFQSIHNSLEDRVVGGGAQELN